MKSFKMYGIEQSKSLLDAQEQIGFLPNIYAVLGENEEVLQTFAGLNAAFAASELSPLEREVVQTAVSVVNQCEYCVAGHTAFTEMASLDLEAIESIRNLQPIKDKKLEALRRFADSIALTKGQASEAELREFIAAGYTHSQVFDVILGAALKAFTNAVSGITGIDLDNAFKPYAWEQVQPEHV